MKRIVQVIIFLQIVCMQSVNGQVWSDPTFPTQEDDIILYFDASKGNGALKGYTQDVYMHTGVITSASSGPSDWQHVVGNWGTSDNRVLMTSEGNDIFSFSYNIRDFYNLNSGEVVEELAFVFRNADGSIVGRDTDGSDIFLPVYLSQEELIANVISPGEKANILFLNDSISIQVQLNRKAWVEIVDNGTLLFQDSIDQVSFWVYPDVIGDHDVEFTFSADNIEKSITRKYLVLDNNETLADPPSGTKPGVNRNLEDHIVFSLIAPLKSHAFLLCPANSFEAGTEYRMTRTVDENAFWIELPKSLFVDGQNCYQYLVDGEIVIADPFSEVVLDPWNDEGVPEDVLEYLPEYPESMTSGIVTAFDIEPSDFDWEISDFEKPDKSNLIIYEILMRDFLSDKNYKSLLDTLDYLNGLGVNAIELMPIQEFEGNQSWGYNPSFHMAVDKYYGSRDQLKMVIDECHKRKIAVILDVVFNHAFSQSPLCQLYWNSVEFRPSSESPYLNQEARHPYNVGYDFNHESEFTKQWVKRVLGHWIEEYKFDGFRFDLSKGLTQTYSGNNGSAMSAYDQSRVDILKGYANYIWSMDGDSYVILEHFADNSEEKVLSEAGMMLWGNINHEFNEAAMGYSSSLNWADYTRRGWSEPHLIAYMESHDEERMGYKIKTYGSSNATYDTQEISTMTNRIAAATAIYLSIPGPKMFWQFGELGYDFSINRCTNGSVNDNCRLDPKPIRWDYQTDQYRNALYDRIAAMTHLKLNYPTFSTTDFELGDANNYVKTVHLNHSEMDAVTIANFDVDSRDVVPNFPYKGKWYEYFTGRELNVTNVQASLDFRPGEYRIYTSERIVPPGGFDPSTEECDAPCFSILPNPIGLGEYFMVKSDNPDKLEELEVYNISGIAINIQYTTLEDGILVELVRQVPNGIYFVSAIINGEKRSGKIVIQN